MPSRNAIVAINTARVIPVRVIDLAQLSALVALVLVLVLIIPGGAG